MHHALCQTLVREAGTPHAETNAVMLPHSARLMEARAPEALRAFREALPAELAALAARSGHTRLASLGVANSSYQRWPRRSRRTRYCGQHARPAGPKSCWRSSAQRS